jgi:hypothetical protein
MKRAVVNFERNREGKLHQKKILHICTVRYLNAVKKIYTVISSLPKRQNSSPKVSCKRRKICQTPKTPFTFLPPCEKNNAEAKAEEIKIKNKLEWMSILVSSV